MMASQLVALQFENARAAAMLQRDEATDAMLAKSQTECERLRQERDRLNGRQVEIEQFLEAIAGQIETSVAARKPLSTGTTMVPLSIRSMVELPCNTIFEAVNSNLGHVQRLSLQNAKLLEAVSVVQQYARGLQKRIAKNDRLYSDVVVSVTEVEEAIVDDLERRGRIQDITNDLRCQMLHKELQKAIATVLLLSKVVGANVVHENERIALLRSAHQSSVGRTISTAARFLRSIDWPAAFQTKEAHAAAAGDQQVVIGDLLRHLHESAAQTERIIARTIADHDAFSVSLERFQDAIGFRDAVIDVLHGRIRRQETALRHARLSCRQVQRASDTQGNVYEQQLRVLRERIERDDEQRLAMIKDADRIQTSLHDRLAAVNSDLARVTVDLNRAQADMVNAQGHRDASEVARAGLSAQLSDARRELQLSAEENERIRRQTSLEIAQLEADLATRQLALDTAQRREREVQLQRDQVVDELDTTRSRLQATGERLDEATRKVASLEASSQETESRLSREYARMKSTMEAQLEAGRRQAMTMEADLRAELSSVNAALKQEIQASMARERHDQATLQECNAARLQLGRAVQQLQMQLAEAQEKLRDCSVERDTARQDGQACQVRLQSVIDGNIIRVGELGKEIEDLKEQVRAGQKVVAELDAARDAIAAAEVQRRRDKEGWERQQQALHGQIQVVEKQRDDLEESLRMQAKKSDRLKEKLRLAQLEVQMTKEAAAKTERELRREKIRSDTMASVQLAQLRNEMSSWQEEKSDLAAEVAFSKALLGFKVAEEADKADDDGGK